MKNTEVEVQKLYDAMVDGLEEFKFLKDYQKEKLLKDLKEYVENKKEMYSISEFFELKTEIFFDEMMVENYLSGLKKIYKFYSNDLEEKFNIIQKQSTEIKNIVEKIGRLETIEDNERNILNEINSNIELSLLLALDNLSFIFANLNTEEFYKAKKIVYQKLLKNNEFDLIDFLSYLINEIEFLDYKIENTFDFYLSLIKNVA